MEVAASTSALNAAAVAAYAPRETVRDDLARERGANAGAAQAQADQAPPRRRARARADSGGAGASGGEGRQLVPRHMTPLYAQQARRGVAAYADTAQFRPPQASGLVIQGIDLYA